MPTFSNKNIIRNCSSANPANTIQNIVCKLSVSPIMISIISASEKALVNLYSTTLITYSNIAHIAISYKDIFHLIMRRCSTNNSDIDTTCNIASQNSASTTTCCEKKTSVDNGIPINIFTLGFMSNTYDSQFFCYRYSARARETAARQINDTTISSSFNSLL